MTSRHVTVRDTWPNCDSQSATPQTGGRCGGFPPVLVLCAQRCEGVSDWRVLPTPLLFSALVFLAHYPGDFLLFYLSRLITALYFNIGAEYALRWTNTPKSAPKVYTWCGLLVFQHDAETNLGTSSLSSLLFANLVKKIGNFKKSTNLTQTLTFFLCQIQLLTLNCTWPFSIGFSQVKSKCVFQGIDVYRPKSLSYNAFNES